MAEDDKALMKLREQYLSSIVPPGDSVSFVELVQRIDQLAETLLCDDNPLSRDAGAQAIENVLQNVKTEDWEGSRLRAWRHLTKSIREDIILLLRSQPTFSPAAPRITIKTLIIPGDTTDEGTLVKGVSALWFEMLRMIQDDPDSIYHIDCWKWEELLAGAYKQEGRDKVVLTPKRGDKGIDVIVEWRDKSQLRFLLLDQMKAYKPGHLIGPDEIREMEGVLLRHPKASKGLITTTSDFTSGALREADGLATRLELRPHDQLITWLTSVAIEDLRASERPQTEGPPNA